MTKQDVLFLRGWKEIATIFNASPHTVRKWHIPVRYIGRTPIITLRELMSWYMKRRKK